MLPAKAYSWVGDSGSGSRNLLAVLLSENVLSDCGPWLFLGFICFQTETLLSLLISEKLTSYQRNGVRNTARKGG